MILVDVNILIYATFDDLAQHRAAREWLDSQLNDAARVGLPWATLLGFLRLATNRRVIERTISMSAAWRQVEVWLARETAWIPQPTEQHAEVLGRLLAEPGVHDNLVPDAHLATLAIEHGLTLYSTDGDFARFPGLRFENPLAS